MIKRCLDLVLSAAALLALALPLAAIALLVRQRLGSPILFRQRRPGLHGRAFQLVKFRTMRDATGRNGELLPDEQRMTPFGTWLRRRSLDELPELWNVLTGDMSLVGPRPLLMEYLPLYTPEQARRHDVRPGITGWAQINGRNAIDWEEKLRLDVWYVDHRTMWLDFRILVATIREVLCSRGITQEGHVTSAKFKGTPE